jgi:uncharacterized protein (TIGR02301 family)
VHFWLAGGLSPRRQTIAADVLHEDPLALQKAGAHSAVMKMAARILVLVTILGLASGAAAQTRTLPDAPAEATESESVPEPLPPVYEDRLLRLSEILGGLHFLRQLCGFEDGAVWRAEMDGLLRSEKPGPVRRARLVSRFNRGFESYHAVYRTCTPSARRAIALYLAEGRRITNDIRARYGQ